MTIQETIYYILSEYPNARYNSRDFYMLMKNNWSDWVEEERRIAILLVQKHLKKLWNLFDNDDYDKRRNFVGWFSKNNSCNQGSVYSVINNFKIAYMKYQNDNFVDEDDDDDNSNFYGGYSVNATADSLLNYDCVAKKSPLQMAAMMCIIDTLNDLLQQGYLCDVAKDINDEFMLRGRQKNGFMAYIGVKAISEGSIAVAKWDMRTGGLDLSTMRNDVRGAGMLEEAIIDIINGK